MTIDDQTIERARRRVGTFVRNKYRLDALLGTGGMASVYAATHRNGRRVALKVLHPELAQMADVRTRFLGEGYAANLVGHPGVVHVIDDDDDDQARTVFLVLELLEGETLEDRAARLGGRMALGEVLSHADRVLDVLACAHERGVVHRDVKPDNLFLTTQADLKVLDFGIARLLDGTGATRSGDLLGTPAFMSPEQANGRAREVDARSDVWSVGAVVFTLLTGEYVHPGMTPSEQLIYAATQQARPLQSAAPWIPADLATVVNCALAFEREARWQNARAMQAALRHAASVPPPRPSASPPISSPTDTVEMGPGGGSTLALELTRRSGRGR